MELSPYPSECLSPGSGAVLSFIIVSVNLLSSKAFRAPGRTTRPAGSGWGGRRYGRTGRTCSKLPWAWSNSESPRVADRADHLARPASYRCMYYPLISDKSSDQVV